MPISSGAGGRAARLHLPGGANKRTYWPNNVNASSSNKSQIDTTKSSISLIDQDLKQVSNHSQSGSGSAQIVKATQAVGSGPSTSSSASNISSQEQRENQQEAVPKKQQVGAKRNRMKIKREQTSGGPNSSSAAAGKLKQDTVEKYKRIRHISRPSSHSTTSPTAIKYFTGDNNECDDEADLSNQQDDYEPTKRTNSDMSSSRGVQSVQTGGGGSGFSLAAALNLTTKVANDNQRANKVSHPSGGKPSSFLGSLITLGANQKTHHNNYQTNNSTTQSTAKATTTATMMKRPANGGSNLNLATAATAHYQTQATINQHNSQASLNPSLSPAFNIGGTGKGVNGGGLASNLTLAASTSSSTANLHSLSSLHQQPTTTTTINKRFNLKYVKTLIVVLMSLDLLITIFVHHFASHDEFSLAFTTSKLRFSTVNLILSAIWFVVLTGAILFDIYFILLVGCLVDIASFVLLLACSTIHFTHRIDYNTVSLTSLLLLLFSIIVLHVYLLVIASLTVYLMLAVKRRRKH